MKFWAVAVVTASLFPSTNTAQENLKEKPVEQSENTLVVTSDLREQRPFDLATSLTLLDSQELSDAAEQHLQEVLGRVPNLNWSAGSSRPRYFQIRGIGERSQYEGAPNPSVGFVVDDVDFSGIGMTASLFDVEQVEVLRGPQGTQYGANALAGLISVTTKAPTDEPEGAVKVMLGDDNVRSFGLMASGPVTESKDLTYRVVLQEFESDGFRRNAFLNRSDTNNRDEQTLRFKLRYQPSQDYQLDFTASRLDFNNGYDAFSIDNSLTTQSNTPGKDSQESTALSLRQRWNATDTYTFLSITAFADSDILQSFDGDWGNDSFWGPDGPYEFISESPRDRQIISQEFRLVSSENGRIFSDSTDWVLGFFGLNLKENNQQTSSGFLQNFDFGTTFLRAEFESKNMALFGQLDAELSSKTRLTVGLRYERKKSNYQDFNMTGDQQLDLSPDDSMWGGQLSLIHQWFQKISVYAKYARGYKAGGFNVSASLPENLREYQPELLDNIEVGAHSLWLDNQLKFNVAFFYSKRDDQQISTSSQLIVGDPNSFVFFTDNAAEGHNLGLEADIDWQLSAQISWFASLGILSTEFDEYDNQAGSLLGREQAHAPSYNYSTGLAYRNAEGWFGRVEVTGQDEFYFSDSHDQVSRSYNLVNLKAGYESDAWSVYFWGRNLTDKEYAIRGFFFGNEPPNFPDTLYIQRGDPRQLGVTGHWYF